MIGLRRQRHRVPLVLGGLIVGLGVVIVAETRLFTDTLPLASVPVTQRKLASAIVDPAQFRLPPLSNYAVVTERPLFSESRRPLLEAASAGDAQSAMFTLVGIVMTGNDRYAVIQHGRPPHLDRAREGQELDGWTIHSIQPDRVVFQRDAQRFDLKFRDGTPPAVSGRAPVSMQPRTAHNQ